MKNWLIIACLSLIASLAQAANPSVAIYWDAVVNDQNGTKLAGSVTYSVYQATGSTAVPVKVQTGITGTSASITLGLTPGTTQCFAVTAVSGGLESSSSLEACTAIPVVTLLPAAPINVKVSVIQN